MRSLPWTIYTVVLIVCLRIYEKYGLKFHFVDMTNPENIHAKLNDKTKLIWIETPTNPLMKLADIQAISIWFETGIYG